MRAAMAARKVDTGWCQVPGCKKPSAPTRANICEMHYGRNRRNGHPEVVVERTGVARSDRGYVLLYWPKHPLAHGRYVYEHRAVLYALHGPKPPPCEWCGKPLDAWNEVHADHLNYERGDNREGNLRVSCRSCNIGRNKGCDLDAWAIGMAARRVLRTHATEYQAEIERIRIDLRDAPNGVAASSAGKRQNLRRAFRAAAQVAAQTAVSRRAEM
jgi:hypothetical protein